MRKLIRPAALILAMLLLAVTLGGCSAEKRKMEKVIGTCAGYDVLYEELRYVTLSHKDEMESTYGKGIWDDPTTAEQYRAELEETVWRMMLSNYAILEAFEAYGGIPNEDMKNELIVNAVDEIINSSIEEVGGKSAFKEEMKALYLTENLTRFILTVEQLKNELYYILTDDLNLIEDDLDAFMDWLEKGNCVYVQHIFIENDAGESKEENRKKAEDVRNQLLGGTDISELVGTSVNEDLQNVAPYYVVRDVYIQQKEDAAFALTEVGAVSDVVETEEGFCVMVRIQDNPATLLSMAPYLLSSYQSAKIDAIIDTYKENLKIELNEYGKSIDLLAIE